MAFDGAKFWEENVRDIVTSARKLAAYFYTGALAVLSVMVFGVAEQRLLEARRKEEFETAKAVTESLDVLYTKFRQDAELADRMALWVQFLDLGAANQERKRLGLSSVEKDLASHIGAIGNDVARNRRLLRTMAQDLYAVYQSRNSPYASGFRESSDRLSRYLLGQLRAYDETIEDASVYRYVLSDEVRSIVDVAWRYPLMVRANGYGPDAPAARFALNNLNKYPLSPDEVQDEMSYVITRIYSEEGRKGTAFRERFLSFESVLGAPDIASSATNILAKTEAELEKSRELRLAMDPFGVKLPPTALPDFLAIAYGVLFFAIWGSLRRLKYSATRAAELRLNEDIKAAASQHPFVGLEQTKPNFFWMNHFGFGLAMLAVGWSIILLTVLFSYAGDFRSLWSIAVAERVVPIWLPLVVVTLLPLAIILMSFFYTKGIVKILKAPPPARRANAPISPG
jgi:hypothetical protein